MLHSVRNVGLAAALLATLAGATGAAQAQVGADGETQATVQQAVPVAPAAVASADQAKAPSAPAAETGKSLEQLATTLASSKTVGADHECLAAAVYFEARGEPLAGQLAVAEVVLNRSRSGKYPADVCAVVKQPAQFSFVQDGRFPAADRSSSAWKRAVAIAKVAQDKLAAELPKDVLYYHADYVAPSWGKRLTRQAKIGLHIFYS